MGLHYGESNPSLWEPCVISLCLCHTASLTVEILMHLLYTSFNRAAVRNSNCYMHVTIILQIVVSIFICIGSRVKPGQAPIVRILIRLFVPTPVPTNFI